MQYLVNHYKAIIKLFRKDFGEVKDSFGVSKTPKIHIIEDHLVEYIDETQCGLGSCTDQTIEALPQVVNRRFTNSKYYVKYLDSEKHPEK